MIRAKTRKRAKSTLYSIINLIIIVRARLFYEEMNCERMHESFKFS